MAAVARRISHDDVLATYNAQGIANTVWGFATLGVHNADLMAAVARRLLHDDVLATFKAQNIANTVWAFATLGVHNADLMAAVARRISHDDVLATFNAQDIANTLWSFAVFDSLHDTSITCLLDRAFADAEMSMCSPQLSQLHQVCFDEFGCKGGGLFEFQTPPPPPPAPLPDPPKFRTRLSPI